MSKVILFVCCLSQQGDLTSSVKSAPPPLMSSITILYPRAYSVPGFAHTTLSLLQLQARCTVQQYNSCSSLPSRIPLRGYNGPWPYQWKQWKLTSGSTVCCLIYYQVKTLSYPLIGFWRTIWRSAAAVAISHVTRGWISLLHCDTMCGNPLSVIVIAESDHILCDKVGATVSVWRSTGVVGQLVHAHTHSWG